MKIALANLVLAATVSGQSIISLLSFGQGSKISPNADSLPGWTLKGEGHEPQILSDKIILTPPDPGHTRGSLWAQSTLPHSEWTTEFHFRASGAERGSGNLQLWYVKDESSIGASSIYTVGQFDGFALTVDTHGGRGGSIRGFLNDGSIAYNQHTNVDSLAFGHCDYSYRNLGRPSVIKIEQSRSLFQVTVDGKVCFETPKVSLPEGNVFGITAATPDNPDSFEIFKFVVSQGAEAFAPVSDQTQQQQQEQQVIPLNNGIQKINEELSQLSQRIDERHQELLNKVSSVSSSSSNAPSDSSNDARLTAIDERLKRIENTLSELQRTAGKDYRNQFTQLQKAIENSHVSLTEALQTSLFDMIAATTPRITLFICVVIALQIFLAAAYIIYKRRRNSIPKKFL